MRCRKCGAELPDGALVCPACGAEQAADPPPISVGDQWTLNRLERPWISLPFVSGTVLAVIALCSGVVGYLLVLLASPLGEVSTDGEALLVFARIVALLTVGLFFRAHLAGSIGPGARRGGLICGCALFAVAAGLSLAGMSLRFEDDFDYAATLAFAQVAAFLTAGVFVFARPLRSWVPGAVVGAVAAGFGLFGLIDFLAQLTAYADVWFQFAFVWAALATALWLGTTSRAARAAGP
jgi:hypothetical protein